MIKIRNLDFKYKTSKSNILENVNLEFKDGEVVSIIGKNGTGKSTLLKLIAGLLKVKNGEIVVDDINVNDKNKFIDIRNKIGIVFQNPDNQILFNRVYDDVKFALDNLNLDDKDNRIKSALKKVDMINYIDSDTFELSLGQKQRINIASVLAVKPKYILLDEPTTMIDSYGKEKIYEIIKELKKEGITIIYVTNNINEILISDRIIMLENQKVKTTFLKQEILENINLLEESEIRVPEIIHILLKLREKEININLKEFTIDEMSKKIIEVCRK